MSDPIRWLDEGADVSPHERELLEAGRTMDPPPDAANMIWLALGPKLVPGAGNGSAGSASSGSSITTAVGGVKAVVVGVTSILVIAGAIAAMIMASPADPAKTSPAAPTAVIAVSPSMIDEVPAKEPILAGPGSEPILSPSASKTVAAETAQGRALSPRRLDAKPIVAAASASVKDAEQVRAERASRLREESRVLAEARGALRGGDPASALEKLDAALGRFPDGILLQEREVLAIEALARSGQGSAASERAAAFLRTYPTSPHATKVRGYVKQ